MSSAKIWLGLAAASAASMAAAGAAHAESGTVSANIAMTSDYVFRGISLSDNGPAVQGGFDYATESYYVGVWGSGISGGMELDLIAGVTPTTGPVSWDLGFIAYFYPGAEDDVAEFDYVELKVGGTIDLTEQFSVGAATYWTGDNWGGTGDALYWEVSGEFAASDALAFNAAFGSQTIDDPDGPLAGTAEGDYNTWNIGARYALHGFEIDLRYHDTDIDAGSPIEAYTYGPASYDAAYVITIGRAL